VKTSKKIGTQEIMETM
jgi:hypothetical protein